MDKQIASPKAFPKLMSDDAPVLTSPPTLTFFILNGPGQLYSYEETMNRDDDEEHNEGPRIRRAIGIPTALSSLPPPGVFFPRCSLLE